MVGVREMLSSMYHRAPTDAEARYIEDYAIRTNGQLWYDLSIDQREIYIMGMLASGYGDEATSQATEEHILDRRLAYEAAVKRNAKIEQERLSHSVGIPDRHLVPDDGRLAGLQKMVTDIVGTMQPVAYLSGSTGTGKSYLAAQALVAVVARGQSCYWIDLTEAQSAGWERLESMRQHALTAGALVLDDLGKVASSSDGIMAGRVDQMIHSLLERRSNRLTIITSEYPITALPGSIPQSIKRRIADKGSEIKL